VRGLSVLGLGMPSFWGRNRADRGLRRASETASRRRRGSGIGGHLEALILPGFTAALAIVPLLVRSLRVGMLEVLNADFVAAERANGLGEVRVLVWHVARNALIPTLTLLGLNIAYLVGSTVTSSRSSRSNGLGFLLLQSITARDFPVVQAITLVLALSVVADQPRHRPRRGAAGPEDPPAMSTAALRRARGAGAHESAGGGCAAPRR